MQPIRMDARPKSRQSTTSATSNTTQAIQPQPAEHTFHQVATQLPLAVWQQHENSLVGLSSHPHYPEGSYGVPGTMQSTVGHHPSPDLFATSLAVNHNVNPSISQSLQTGHYGSIGGRDTPAMDMSMDEQFDEDQGGNPAKRRKGASNNQANDVELKRLLKENEGRELTDVAQQFLKDEPGSKLEKLKQIFGMLWLKQSVQRVEGVSVPRNAVYNDYTYCCGDHRVQTLNPASFGKLVRIIFPQTATRRLGVRGNSKYHYVNLTLINESKSDLVFSNKSINTPKELSNQVEVSRTFGRSQASLPPDNAVFAPSETPGCQPLTSNMRHPNSDLLYPPQIASNRNRVQSLESALIQRPLKFPNSLEHLQQTDVDFEMLDINPYLPPGTDEVAANALVSVYRSHCILAIDNFRFCRTDKFCDSYKSLVGLLTVPGQKLLASPNLADWIRECDWRKYKAMVPMLNIILLTQVPQKAMVQIQTVAIQLCDWIRAFFQTQPEHVLSAMLGPACVFVNVLERFCRVQNACTELAPVFTSQAKRNALWNDWVLHVQPLHVVQNSLTGAGHRRCRLILTQEVRLLLIPTQGPELQGTLFEDDAECMTEFHKNEVHRACAASEDLIARLFRFILSLPTRFPAASAREILVNTERFTSNATRNLTLAGATTLPEWWRIKVFIDETCSWLAEMGGLAENGSTVLDINQDLSNEAIYDFGDFDTANSRPTTGVRHKSIFDSPDITTNHGRPGQVDQLNRRGSLVQQSTASTDSFHSIKQGAAGKENEVHNDSGIGLGIDEEFNMDAKYGSFVEGVNGSDPADVVVC